MGAYTRCPPCESNSGHDLVGYVRRAYAARLSQALPMLDDVAEIQPFLITRRGRANVSGPVERWTQTSCSTDRPRWWLGTAHNSDRSLPRPARSNKSGSSYRRQKLDLVRRRLGRSLDRGQCRRIRLQFLQRLALDARHNTAHQPARLAHLDDHHQGRDRIQTGSGFG
jgi:hypothetical protein